MQLNLQNTFKYLRQTFCPQLYISNKVFWSPLVPDNILFMRISNMSVSRCQLLAPILHTRK